MRFLVGAMLFSASLGVLAQQPTRPPAAEHEKPLPDLVTIMQKAILKERASETALQGYLVHETLSLVEGLGRGSYWESVSEEDRESEGFWLQGVRVSRLVRTSGFTHHDRGYGHTLSPEELHRENARIDAELVEVAKARVAGDTEGERRAAGILNEIRVSRFLELGTYTNLRRGDRRGRKAIIVDYQGRACVDACTLLDRAARYIEGTLWIDEEDLAVSEFKGRFIETWIEPGKGGQKVLKGSTLAYVSVRRDDGVWFPASMLFETQVNRGSSAHTSSVLLSFNGYSKFRATSTILPDYALVPEDVVPEAPTTTSPPR